MERCHQRDNTNPSFSSTLLDAIYRSIDESNDKGEEEKEVILYRERMRKKHNNNGFSEETSLQKAFMIEKWMQEKVSYEKVSVRRKSMADFDKNIARVHQNDFNKPSSAMLLNSSSTSSESSCGGGFSSSESESFYGGLSSTKSSSSTYSTMQRPKPIRTSVSARPIDEIGLYHYNHERKITSTVTQKPKNEGSFGKTKSKALKIYGDLKKVKQPISPGGRLASFLNSLFTTGNAKKAKISSSSSISEQTSTCSSASSFSRSCLSKTPSSTRGNKLNNGTKRSVRFYPVSVIVDEDSRPCGHKNVYENNQEESKIITNEELKFHVMKESRRVEEVARDLLKNYEKKKQEELCLRDHCNNINGNGEFSDDDQELDDYDGDDDDRASYASSDLFELDNLSAIGIDQRYCQELPVYETTHLDTNRAIANGLIL